MDNDTALHLDNAGWHYSIVEIQNNWYKRFI